ncbi:hypothetical protein H1C71_007177 [Ictidomys tridecemlineatus]|nr:hypothetical protein H1C71_007177 [Ictidomys tridecemlineatus]
MRVQGTPTSFPSPPSPYLTSRLQPHSRSLRICQGFGGTFNLSVSLGSSGKPSTVEWTPRPGTAVLLGPPPSRPDPGEPPSSQRTQATAKVTINIHRCRWVVRTETRPTGG